MTYVVTAAEGKPADLLGLIYIASPYTLYVHGLYQAFVEACVLTGKLLKAGLKVYSPIVFTHELATHAKLDHRDHSIWLPFDEAMMEKADVLLIAEMDGWHKSFGIAYEIAFFERAKKPILYIDPNTMAVKATPSAQVIPFPWEKVGM